MFIYFWERQSKQGRGRERGRHRIQSRLQALSCQHRAWWGARTRQLRAHDLSQSWMLNWAPWVPLCIQFCPADFVVEVLMFKNKIHTSILLTKFTLEMVRVQVSAKPYYYVLIKQKHCKWSFLSFRKLRVCCYVALSLGMQKMIHFVALMVIL